MGIPMRNDLQFNQYVDWKIILIKIMSADALATPVARASSRGIIRHNIDFIPSNETVNMTHNHYGLIVYKSRTCYCLQVRSIHLSI